MNIVEASNSPSRKHFKYYLIKISMTNFREYTLKSGKKILAGKSASQNDLLMSSSKYDDYILHTVYPGSPFVNIGESPTKDEIKEASIFCAARSQDYRDNRKNVLVHLFLKKDAKKTKKSKEGSWSVSKVIKIIKVKKSDILQMEKSLSNTRKD